MAVLREHDGFGCWPECVSAELVGPCGFDLVTFFLPTAGGAGVVITDGVKTM